MKTLCMLLAWWASPPPRPSIPAAVVRVESLRTLMSASRPDSTRVLLLTQLAYEYTQTDPLATIAYGKQALQLAQKLRFQRGEGWALVRLGSGFREAGNYPAALQLGLQGLRVAEVVHDPELIGRAFNALGYLYWEQGNSRPALAYLFRAKAVGEKHHNLKLLTRVMGNIGNVYTQLHRFDSAQAYSQRGFALGLSQHDLTSEVGDAATLGNIYEGLGSTARAQYYYRRSARRALSERITFALCRAYLGQARLFKHRNGLRSDSALYYGQQALAAGQQGHYPKGVLDASKFLAAAYAARHDSARAFGYLILASATRDSLFSQTKMAQVQALDVSEQLRQQDLADREAQADRKRRYYWLVAALASTVPALLLLWRNNRHKQRANQQLNAQNAQIAVQRDELRSTVAQLKETQAQLVQSEKMASLGELTAGIAHEMQNPLNFVNNFAEVSVDLVAELREAQTSSAAPGAPEAELWNDLVDNLQKIKQHGQRAAGIVKGMLEHARHDAGPRQHTDLNALCAEYLHLASQSPSGAAPACPVAITTDFAPGLPRVPLVPQDMGRVLLNLFANALYAVRQRQQAGEPNYVPTVHVLTERAGGHVRMRVRDNGMGMPAAVQAKVFQPFFTTKPVGEGTGLGLSLSHNIVTQGHGGTLSVTSSEGEGTEFVVTLPV